MVGRLSQLNLVLQVLTQSVGKAVCPCELNVPTTCRQPADAPKIPPPLAVGCVSRHNLKPAEWCPSGRRSGPGKLVLVQTGRGFESHLLRQNSSMSFAPTPEERAQREAIIQRVVEFTLSGTTIKLPAFNPDSARPNDRFALLAVGQEENDFRGQAGEFVYQFEGEEDLLHLMITRADLSPLSPEEGQQVAAFVLDGVPPALVWFKPGEQSQHFYAGHDDVVQHVQR